MTKEEFSNIINEEIKTAQEKFDEAKKMTTYFEKIGDIGLGIENKELESAKFQYDLYYNRIIMLYQLLNLPAYARIQAASDAEIEIYKKQKAEEIELKIEENNLLLEIERKKYEELLSERLGNISKLDSASFQEREKLIERGKEIQQALIQYECSNEWGVFGLYEKLITDLKQQQQQIINSSSQKIKDELCLKIEKVDYFKKELEHETKYGISVTSRLIASVSNEPKKALQMANLLERFSKLYRKKEMYSNHLIKISANLPKNLIDSLYKKDHLVRQDLDLYVNDSNIEELEKEVTIAEEKFLYEKDRIAKEFTYEKLKFFQYERDSKGSNEIINPEFIEQHKEKIKESTLSLLEFYIKNKERPSRNLFVFAHSKDNESIDYIIKALKDDIYVQVENWYQTQCYGVLGPNKSFHSYGNWSSREGKKSIQTDITRLEETITVSEILFNNLKQDIQEAKEKISIENNNRNEMLTQISTQIRNLAGKEYENVDIVFESELEEKTKFQVISEAREMEEKRDTQNVEILNKPKLENSTVSEVISASNAVYQSELVKRIQEEAKKQAEGEEATIKGFSLEKLKKLKEELGTFNSSDNYDDDVADLRTKLEEQDKLLNTTDENEQGEYLGLGI